MFAHRTHGPGVELTDFLVSLEESLELLQELALLRTAAPTICSRSPCADGGEDRLPMAARTVNVVLGSTEKILIKLVRGGGGRRPYAG